MLNKDFVEYILDICIFYGSIGICVLIFFGTLIFQFIHPELTQTELLIECWEFVVIFFICILLIVWKFNKLSKI
jgi:hypothetical protein